MTQSECGVWVRSMMAAGRLGDLYRSQRWKVLRKRILAKYKHECQHCKERGRYRQADTVHHDRFVDKYPELALSEFYIDEHGEQKPNLIAVCHDCHEKIHGYRTPGKNKQKKNVPSEWW